ncbi:GNAT family N-acetyltransferase [Promicromonospora soli]|uniref:Acetyltransferase n=1 Tax=Promicromonospora soli TaxID=2035533 RepID=A0A919FKH5_9MICO|nr:GNAT family protein [Promicromonospora soli]GHH67799.1 acetyltransferase [Promicromonospora soli]
MTPETYARGATAAGTTVVLRGWTGPDLDCFRAWLRPEHDWHRWDGPYYPVPTEEQADAHVATLAQEHGLAWPTSSTPTSSMPTPAPPPSGPEGLPPRRLVVDVDGELVGTVAWYWESRETEWARLGITVYDPAVRGRGIGRSALALWTSFLFAGTPWVRLDFATWSGNRAMLGVGKSLGFVEEARFRQARVVDGVRHDSVVMGVLRGEWREPPGIQLSVDSRA